MRIEFPPIEQWTECADSRGNRFYLSGEDIPQAMLVYDDDAFHCLAGAGWSWRVYENGIDQYTEDIVPIDMSDRSFGGFMSAEEAYENLLVHMADGMID